MKTQNFQDIFKIFKGFLESFDLKTKQKQAEGELCQAQLS